MQRKEKGEKRKEGRFDLSSLSFPLSSRLKGSLPVMVVVGILILLGYPLALVFGLPLAKRDMEDLRKWQRAVVAAEPLQDLSESTRLLFARVPENAVLVRGGAPLSWRYTKTDEGVTLLEPPPEPLVSFRETLTPLSPSVYRFSTSIPEVDPERALYVGDRLAIEGSVPPREIPEGERTVFTFPNASGPVIIDGRLLTEGQDYTDLGEQVRFEVAPAFGSQLRRVSGDYAVLHAEEGTVVFAQPPEAEVRAAASVVRLAEVLAGASDGNNRRFGLSRPNVLETDRSRAIFVDDRLLSDAAERPAERVDGLQRRFTFASAQGIVTVDGMRMVAGQDYTREENVVTFSQAPVRNATLRQYPDYYLVDARAGVLELAEAPSPGSVVWAQQYTVYSHPSCGNTLLACFYALPQHPVPFPHWIVQRVRPFVEKYPLFDERNVVRATLYTTLGTLSALGLGAAVGMVLAVLFVLLRPLERALLPWVIASQTVPIIALVPVLLLILGHFGITIQTSMLPTAIIGAYIAFFPVVVGTVKGLRSVDPLALDLMKSYAASPLQLFLKLRFPAAVPFFFVSLKLGTAAALVGALVAETESNNRRGLGFQILGQVQSGNVADVWILLIVSALLGIGLVSLIGLVQRVLVPWERP